MIYYEFIIVCFSIFNLTLHFIYNFITYRIYYIIQSTTRYYKKFMIVHFNIFNSTFYNILINSLHCRAAIQIHRFSNISFDVQFLLCQFFQYFILEPCSRCRKESRKSSNVKQIGKYSRNILTHYRAH